MKLEIISEEEFKEYADKSEQITFHQTVQWANLKKVNNWHSYYIGLRDGKKIMAASLILSKELPLIKKKMF